MGATKIFVPKLSAGVAGPRTGREPPRQRGLGAATLRFLRGALGDREATGWVVIIRAVNNFTVPGEGPHNILPKNPYFS